MKEEQLKELIEYRDGLNKEIISHNKFLRSKNDMGQVGKSDPMGMLSFTRGQVIGLIISRDRINKIIEKWQKKTNI